MYRVEGRHLEILEHLLKGYNLWFKIVYQFYSTLGSKWSKIEYSEASY